MKLPRNMTRHKYVNKRGKTVYYYFAQISHKQIPLGTSYLIAREKLLDVLYEVAKTRKIKSAGTTFEQWSRRYLDLMANKASVDRDRQIIHHLNNYFGSMSLIIPTTKVIDYKNRRLSSGLIRAGKICDARVKLSTVQREMSCLRHMLNLACDDGLIKKEDLPIIKLESEERFERDRTLSDNEYKNYLQHCPRWYQRIVIAAYETGMSRKDILLLPWINVDRAKRIIRGKRVKRGVRQIVPITGKLPTILDELKKEQKGQATEMVFTKDGQPITAIMVRNAHDVAVKRADIQDFHFHDLRHTAKSRWARRGIPAEIAMLATGQKSLRMHYRYVDLKEEDVVEAFKSFME